MASEQKASTKTPELSSDKYLSPDRRSIAEKRSITGRTISTASSDADRLSFTSSAAISDFTTHTCNPFYDVRWFVFFFYIVTLAIYAVLAHNVAIARTLEKRFGFSSFQIGFISSTNDIINLILVLFVGYLGNKFSKPRMLGILCMIGGCGCMLFALPYALFPRTIVLDNADPTNSTSDETFANDLVCGNQPQNYNNTLCDGEVDESLQISRSAYGIMLIASAMLGFGNSGLSILSVGYIDDNLPRNVAAFYIGIVSSAYPVGPLIGFVLSTVTLQLPENLKEAYFPNNSPSFIGCWWLAYLIFGSLVFLSAVPMMFCPKHLPHYYKMKARLRKLKKLKKLPSIEDVTPPRGFGPRMKVIGKSFCGVISNLPYMLLVLSTMCCYYILPGIYQQVPKYLQIQFHVDAALSSIYTGLCGALISALSLVAVGYVVKRFKLETRGACALYILSIVGTQLSITAMLPWECDQTLLAGAQVTREGYEDLREYYPQCQENCNCTRVSPVCNDRLDIAFISPCHAGCQIYNPRNDTYLNCQCVKGWDPDLPIGDGVGGPMKNGLCEKETCDEYIAFLTGFAVFNVFSAMSRVGGLILQLRLVEKELRSFSLGFTSFIHNGLVFIPGPIIFGLLFDSTCLLWQALDCGEDGTCLLYNMPQFRTYMHGIPLTILGGGLIMAFILFCLIRARTKAKSTDSDSEVESDEDAEINNAYNRLQKNNAYLNNGYEANKEVFVEKF